MVGADFVRKLNCSADRQGTHVIILIEDDARIRPVQQYTRSRQHRCGRRPLLRVLTYEATVKSW
jgi:hypothetical protein